jgi:hypothetical protein
MLTAMRAQTEDRVFRTQRVQNGIRLDDGLEAQKITRRRGISL